MNRREFTVGTACLLGAVALGFPSLALAQRRPEEGKEYKVLDKPVPTDAGAGKIEVIEFFWYSCPHCFAFEPTLVNWIKAAPADVVVRRVPVAFRDDFVPQQRLYYALEAMGRLGDVHQKVFDAIHKDRQQLNREDVILAFIEKNGVDRAKFQEHYNSFTVQTKARRAAQLQDLYRVEGVPALGIAGRYYTDATLSGSMERSVQVAEFLIAESRRK